MQRAKAQQSGMWNSALRVFEQWLDANAAQRAALLEQLAAGDPDMHASLLRLIAADREAESAQFLNFGAMVDAVSGDSDEPAYRDLTDTELGAWRIERLLGHGGSGQVWLAQRCDGRHTAPAAIKVLRVASGDRSSRLRFAREARLLARLGHAHIARLLDVGDTAEGERYLVLEYVDGERIDLWCDEHSLNVEARLRLFLQVCDAVAYAHANLVVHRDLKPSNIFVQDDGDVKVLDWGVAKLLDSDSTEDDGGEVTRLGGAPFTPEYAAPEQFEGKPVTVSTDIYSLGVVLYLLLAGKRPYEAEATPRQLASSVLDGVPRRLAQALEHTQDPAEVARHRGTTPQALRRVLRGDLDTILGKALKRDPAERYASSQALADDVRRYLERKPIRARAESSVYRARMFIKRHRGSVALGCATLLSLLVGSGTLVMQDYRLQAEVKRANAIKQFLLDSISNVDAYYADGRPALDPVTLVKKAADAIDSELPADDATRAELYERFGKVLTRFGQFDDAERLDRKAAEAYRRMEGEYSLRAFAVEASAIARVMDRGEVEQAQKQTEDLLTRIAVIPNPQDLRLARFKTLLLMAFDADQVGNLALARGWARRAAIELRADIEQEHGYYANSRRRLAVVALEDGDVREAVPLLQELVRFGLTLPPDPQLPGLYLHYLVWALFEQGNYAEAKPIADAAIAMMHRLGRERMDEIVQLYADRAEVEAGLGDDAAAERDFAAAQAYAEELFKYKPHERSQLALRYGYGMYLAEHGRFDEATTQFTACQSVINEMPNNWHNVRAACAAGAAYAAAHGSSDRSAQIAELDRLIGELRAHASRDLPRVLWLRARLAADRIADDSPQQQLAWLDEARTVLNQSGRGGARLAQRIEADRLALGAPSETLRADSGHDLIEAANAILLVSR